MSVPAREICCRMTGLMRRLVSVGLVSIAGCDIWSASPPPPAAAERAELVRGFDAAVNSGTVAAPPADEVSGSPAAVAPPPPIPALRPYPEWTMRETVVDSLGRIGPSVVPELLEALRDPRAETRWQAVQLLGRIGPAAEEAVPDLIRMLQDVDPRVRRAAARALGQIGPSAAPAVPALIQLMDDVEE